jgi:hypothetical protein
MASPSVYTFAAAFFLLAASSNAGKLWWKMAGTGDGKLKSPDSVHQQQLTVSIVSANPENQANKVVMKSCRELHGREQGIARGA